MRRNVGKVAWVASLLLIAAVCWGIAKGSANIPLSELFRLDNRPILQLRLARILMAVLAGGGLTVAGLALQAVLRNPLAEPYLLGTSSGAGLGAVAGLLLGIFPPLTSFVGAVVSLWIVYRLAEKGGGVSTQSMILSGVVVSMALSAVIVFLVSISSLETLRGVLWWLWGSLEVYDLRLLAFVGGAVLLGVPSIFFLSRELNAISLGEEEAIHLGVDAEKIKKFIFLITALMTAALICACGIIGFVGLIVPHAMRSLVGPDHKALIPLSALAGAAFLTACDVLSRTVMAPYEVPIGVITAAVGAPLFLFLMRRSRP